jgi:hypothetical protein
MNAREKSKSMLKNKIWKLIKKSFTHAKSRSKSIRIIALVQILMVKSALPLRTKSIKLRLKLRNSKQNS